MEQRAPFFEAFLNADGAEGFVDADIDVAGMGDIFEPQLQRVYPKPARGHVEVVLEKERELGAGPAAKCAGNGRVGDDGAAGVFHVRIVVAAEELIRHGSAVVLGVAEVCPGVECVVSLHAHQLAVRGVEPLDLNIHRRAANGGGEDLLAGEHELHRPFSIERGGRGHRLGDPLLLGTERATHGGFDNADVSVRERENVGDHGADTVYGLVGAVNGELLAGGIIVRRADVRLHGHVVDAGEMHLRFDRDKLSGGQLTLLDAYLLAGVAFFVDGSCDAGKGLLCGECRGVDLVVDLYAPGSLAGAFKGIGEDAADLIADKADAAVEDVFLIGGILPF